jgi:formate--tetrahydrofolate ligase
MKSVKSDIEIARACDMKPVTEIAARLNIPEDKVLQYGPHKGKVDLGFLESLSSKGDGKLVLVTAISPTPAGEGKTTTTVGLGDALNRIGKKASICIREPSLGPCFGMKGGAAGGGMSQVVPMEDINLHFTGDFHAVGVAHNLLSALIDNHIYWGNGAELDSRRVTWRRVVDMNDRALREITTSLGGVANGFPREDGFDIVVASEVMAVFCLAESLADLTERLSKIVVGFTRDRVPVTAGELQASGPMSVLLKDALAPNIVQTLEGNPAFIHGGPFANIAHGCNSVIATKAALKLSDYVVTEAGFGADLGAEKFFDIKCRKAGLNPDAAVIVATVRALKMHGGVAKADLTTPDVEAVRKGCANLGRHIRNVRSFGVPAIVAINRFSADEDAELEQIEAFVKDLGCPVVRCTHWGDGGEGAEDLANQVVALAESGAAQFAPIYSDSLSLWEKMERVATQIYGASGIQAEKKVRNQIKDFQAHGYGDLPICMAKTQYSFSTDPSLLGAPSNHSVTIREVRLAAGAGFIVAVCGDIMTMPGLPRNPAAHSIHLNDEGLVEGLF